MELALIVRATVALLFVASAVGKLTAFRGFVTALRGYAIVPERLLTPAAALLTALEVAIAAALIAGVAVPAALLAAAVLLGVFAIVVARTLLAGRRIDCGCLGQVSIELDWAGVWINAGLAAAALAASTAEPVGIPLPSGAAADFSTTLAVWLAASVLAITYWLAAYARTVLRRVDRRLAEEL